MSERRADLEEAIARQHDPAALAAYADWLAERGATLRATGLRLLADPERAASLEDAPAAALVGCLIALFLLERELTPKLATLPPGSFPNARNQIRKARQLLRDLAKPLASRKRAEVDLPQLELPSDEATPALGEELRLPVAATWVALRSLHAFATSSARSRADLLSRVIVPLIDAAYGDARWAEFVRWYGTALRLLPQPLAAPVELKKALGARPKKADLATSLPGAVPFAFEHVMITNATQGVEGLTVPRAEGLSDRAVFFTYAAQQQFDADEWAAWSPAERLERLGDELPEALSWKASSGFELVDWLLSMQSENEGHDPKVGGRARPLFHWIDELGAFEAGATLEDDFPFYVFRFSRAWLLCQLVY